MCFACEKGLDTSPATPDPLELKWCTGTLRQSGQLIFLLFGATTRKHGKVKSSKWLGLQPRLRLHSTMSYNSRHRTL